VSAWGVGGAALFCCCGFLLLLTTGHQGALKLH
jgi:hypothetical protein